MVLPTNGGIINQVCWSLVKRILLRALEDSLFWVKNFVLRRKKKPPDPVICDMPEMFELVTCFQTTMGTFDLAKKAPKIVMGVAYKVTQTCMDCVWPLAAQI